MAGKFVTWTVGPEPGHSEGFDWEQTPDSVLAEIGPVPARDRSYSASRSVGFRVAIGSRALAPASTTQMLSRTSCQRRWTLSCRGIAKSVTRVF